MPPTVTDWAAIRARLKAAREAKGWTQRELGEALGLATTRIGQIESSVAVSEELLARIAEALGRSVVWLRYGVAEGLDVEAIRREGEVAGRQAALAEVYAQLLASGFDVPAAPVTPLPRLKVPYRRIDAGAAADDAQESA